jgi:hypothetical protein
MEIDALFRARQVGTTGHEILDPQGTVIAWTVNEPWAAVIVALLNDHRSINAACFFLSRSDRFGLGQTKSVKGKVTLEGDCTA